MIMGKIFCALVLAGLMAAPAARCQREDVDVNELVDSGLEWVEENLPESVQDRILGIDWEYYLEKLLTHLQEYSWEEMAGCEEQAQSLLAALKKTGEYQPLVVWLETRMDYFAMADEFLRDLSEVLPEPEAEAAPPPVAVPGTKPPPPPVPKPRKRPAYPTQKKWEARLKSKPAPVKAEALVPSLKKIFVEQGVPGELVWIAEVESSFDPAARSPAGAAGLFQFMPATAERFGLSTSPVDERHDPEKSAAAAAQYLAELHRQFHSWPLALAAYNAGENRVSGLLKKYGAKDFDTIAERLPLETRLYVPKVLATVSLREGVNAETLQPPS